MVWDAGAIRGKLELDGKGLTHGVLEAEGIMRLFPASVSEFMADPLLGIAEIGREAFEGIKDALKETVDEAAQMKISADMLGVPVEFLSRWTGVAQAFNVSQGELTNGMRMLTLRAGEALEGNKQLRQAFEDIGITMEWLNDHANDSAAIFQEIDRRISLIPDSTHRGVAAWHLLGREAAALTPIFTANASDVQHLIDMHDKLGATVENSEAQQAMALKRLQAEYGFAAEGIQKSFVLGFMDALSKNTDQIENDLIGSTQAAQHFGETLGKVATDALPLLLDGLKVLDEVLKDTDEMLEKIEADPHSAGSYTFGLHGGGQHQVTDPDQIKINNEWLNNPQLRADAIARIQRELPGSNPSSWSDPELRHMLQELDKRDSARAAGGVAGDAAPNAAQSATVDSGGVTQGDQKDLAEWRRTEAQQDRFNASFLKQSKGESGETSAANSAGGQPPLIGQVHMHVKADVDPRALGLELKKHIERARKQAESQLNAQAALE